MASVAPARNPRDNMKSTWRTADKSTWGPFHWIFEILSMHPNDIGKATKINQKSDPVPWISQFDSHKFVLFYALWPMVVQQAYIWITGENWSPYFAFFFYSLVFKINAIFEFRMIRKNGHKYGFLDGDVHERDQIPDHSVHKVFFSLQMTSLVRPAAAILLCYKRSEGPLQGLSPWVILETGLYGIILDFYFYWYHRVMHETDFLWKYHRTHHLTKHPNPLLTLFADSEQEFFDVIGVPMMTWATMRLMGLPMGFYDWWICHQYIVFTELVGHSGLRVYANPPSSLGWFLNIFDANLCIEDHDLHHRKGWKNSANYGKQTRLWDKIFGTCAERIEMKPENIVKGEQVHFTIFN